VTQDRRGWNSEFAKPYKPLGVPKLDLAAPKDILRQRENVQKSFGQGAAYNTLCKNQHLFMHMTAWPSACSLQRMHPCRTAIYVCNWEAVRKDQQSIASQHSLNWPRSDAHSF